MRLVKSIIGWRFLRFIALALPLVFACQTFGIKKPVPKPIGSFQTIDTGKYLISADLLSPEQSEKYFGVDLPKLGIQIINLGIENKAPASLQLNLDEIFIRDKDKYLYRPLSLNELARRIYKANKYKEMVNYGAKKGVVYGISGAIIGAVTGIIASGKAGKGAAIGGWSLGTINAVRGAEEAKHKASERIREDLESLIMVPGRIPYDTKVRGLLFFAIPPEEIQFLELRLEEQQTREKLNLNLEILRQPD